MPNSVKLAGTVGSDSGAATFERYRWQAKMALLAWLTCLSADPKAAPMAVVCEHLEDIVVCEPADSVFAQLKTRDRGSWSDKAVSEDKGALHSLSRTYAALNEMAITPPARLELRLEGAAASTKKTAEFFADPRSADSAMRERLVKLGVKKASVSAFLALVTIRPNQPARAHIDAVILQAIGATWPSMSHPDRLSLCLQLLAEVELAQEGRRALSTPLAVHVRSRIHELCDGKPDLLDGKVLTASDLEALAPPLPGASPADILERAARGDASVLELKLRAAGSSQTVVDQALSLRAAAEVQRQERLALAGGAGLLADIDSALLMLANATAHQANLLGGSNPSIAARPADYVFNTLIMNPQALLAVDVKTIFEGHYEHVLGYLCHLSDTCHFAWRS